MRFKVELQYDIMNDRKFDFEPEYWCITKFHPKEEFMAHVKNVPHMQLYKLDDFLRYYLAEVTADLNNRFILGETYSYDVTPSSDWVKLGDFYCYRNSYKITFLKADGTSEDFRWLPFEDKFPQLNFFGEKAQALITSGSGDIQIWLSKDKAVVYTKRIDTDKVIIMPL